MTSYNDPEVLVNTQWVADHLKDPQVRLIEVVWDKRKNLTDYESGHIPGAVAWDFEKDLQDTVRHDILDKEGMEALLSQSGITNEMTIVVYSGMNNLLATYAFWQLNVFQHNDIRLMDGDRQKWLDENRPTTSEVPFITKTMYQVQEPNWSIRVNKNDVIQSIGKKGILFVDTRSVEMYNGTNKANTQRGGHIPDAVNLPALNTQKGWQVPTVKSDGTFKSSTELQSLFNSLGITSDKEIITYCVRGGLSTHAWFVLTQLLGYTNVREYDKSWAEWGNLEEAPIET